MNIVMQFEGFDELLKAFEKAASNDEIVAVNKKITQTATPFVRNLMSRKMPRSTDVSKSGRGYGKVTAHAADEIPLGKVKVRGHGATVDIGWTESDKSEHFYVKFINWGTIYQPPREFIYATGREANPIVQKIAEQEYQAFLDRTVR